MSKAARQISKPINIYLPDAANLVLFSSFLAIVTECKEKRHLAMPFQIYLMRTYRATFTARFSRITVTLIWPG